LASWRTGVVLGPGKYRFTGRVRTKGIVIPAGIVNVGGCLRTSNGAQQKGLSGDTGWTRLTYEFEVRDGERELQFLCELRATQGQIWFDLDSLRLLQVEQGSLVGPE
jgi:hypothetical protein